MKFIKFHKSLTIVLALLLVIFIVFFAYSEIIYNEKKDNKKVEKCEIALLTYGKIDSEYFNKIEKGVSLAAKTDKIKYKVFSVDDCGGSYEDTLKKVISVNPYVIIMPDESFAETLYNNQKKYEKINFILIGATPHNKDNTDSEVADNVMCVTYDDAESGFVAGYISVQNGYDNLAFVCNDDDERSIHYYYGFLQGANYAAALNTERKVKVTVYHKSKEDKSFTVNKIETSVQIIATSDDKVVKNLVQNSDLSKIPVLYLGDNKLNNKNVSGMIINDIPLSIQNAINTLYEEQEDADKKLNIDISNNTIMFEKYNDDFKKIDNDTINGISEKMKNKDIIVINDTSISIDELDVNSITYYDNKIIK